MTIKKTFLPYPPPLYRVIEGEKVLISSVELKPCLDYWQATKLRLGMRLQGYKKGHWLTIASAEPSTKKTRNRATA